MSGGKCQSVLRLPLCLRKVRALVGGSECAGDSEKANKRAATEGDDIMKHLIFTSGWEVPECVRKMPMVRRIQMHRRFGKAETGNNYSWQRHHETLDLH